MVEQEPFITIDGEPVYDFQSAIEKVRERWSDYKAKLAAAAATLPSLEDMVEGPSDG